MNDAAVLWRWLTRVRESQGWDGFSVRHVGRGSQGTAGGSRKISGPSRNDDGRRFVAGGTVTNDLAGCTDTANTACRCMGQGAG